MKQQIIIQMLIDLLSGKKVSASTLAKRYSVSTRSIYRYVDELNIAGIPVELARGRGGGIYIPDSYKLPVNFMTKEEYLCTVDALKAYPEDCNAETVASAIEKITRQTKRESLHLNFGESTVLIDGTAWGGNAHTFNEKINLIQQALGEHRLLDIEYVSNKNESTARRIEPCLLILKQNVWYVYAYCRLRYEFRLFKLARIRKAILTESKYTPRALDKKSIPLHYDKIGKLIDVSLRFDDSALTDAIEWLGAECIERDENGYFANVSLPDDQTLIAKLLSFGRHVCVQSPEYFKKRLLKEALALTEIYATQSPSH